MKQILDSCAIVRGDLDFSKGNYVITNGVLQEIKDQTTKEILNSHLRKENIELEIPSSGFIEKIEEKARETSDSERLSSVDKEILALAYQKNYSILTDDYSIQNMARELSIDYQGLRQDGISEKLSWYLLCEGCGERYSYGKQIWECEICGSKLRKKAKKK